MTNNKCNFDLKREGRVKVANSYELNVFVFFFVNQIHSTFALKLWQSTIKRRDIFEKEFGHFVVNLFFYQIFNVTWFDFLSYCGKHENLEIK